ncbi:hypothetical protein ACOSQ2_002923 [Xanthoceras sorbifolium]
MDQFLKRCFYHSGQYNSEEHFAELDIKLKEKEAGRKSNRLFYLSISPNIFVDVVKCASLRASSASGRIRYSGSITIWARNLLRIYQCFDYQFLFLSLYGPETTFATCNLYFLKTLVQRDEGDISIITES